MEQIDELVYEIQLIEQYMPYYVNIINNYNDTNKFREAFIHYKLKKILDLADSLLISGDGHCNWDNIDILKSYGFYVGPGERDRFGWVTGIIGTSKGDIVFG